MLSIEALEDLAVRVRAADIAWERTDRFVSLLPLQQQKFLPPNPSALIQAWPTIVKTDPYLTTLAAEAITRSALRSPIETRAKFLLKHPIALRGEDLSLIHI